jgi:hypothetical protein
VRDEVTRFKRGFTSVRYCFHEPFDAYKYHELI